MNKFGKMRITRFHYLGASLSKLRTLSNRWLCVWLIDSTMSTGGSSENYVSFKHHQVLFDCKPRHLYSVVRALT